MFAVRGTTQHLDSISVLALVIACALVAFWRLWYSQCSVWVWRCCCKPHITDQQVQRPAACGESDSREPTSSTQRGTIACLPIDLVDAVFTVRH